MERVASIPEYYEDLWQIAKMNDVNYSFVYVNSIPKDKRDGMYFVITPDLNAIVSLKEDPQKLVEVMNYDEKKPQGTVNPYCMYTKITDDKPQTLIKNDCINKVQLMNLIRSSFHECGKPIPKTIRESEIEVIKDLNKARYNSMLSPSVQASYHKIFKKFIERYSKRSDKERDNYTMTFAEKMRNFFGSQRVSAKYFENNCLAVRYVGVYEDFFNYFKKEIKSMPQVKYYLSNYKGKVKDISNIIEGPYNYLKNDTGYESRIIGVSEYDYETLLKIKAEYSLKGYQTEQLEALKKNIGYEGLAHTRISHDTIVEFSNYCKSNKIQFSFDLKGIYGQIEESCPMIIYRRTDENRINNAIKEIVERKQNKVIVNKDQETKSKENAPKYKNPYVKDVLEPAL